MTEPWPCPKHEMLYGRYQHNCIDCQKTNQERHKNE